MAETREIAEWEPDLDPNLPEGFDDTPNRRRPREHAVWWFIPYLVTVHGGYQLRCLDGGAWDRSVMHGNYDLLEDAVEAAKSLHQRLSGYRQMTLRDALYCLWYRQAVVVIAGDDFRGEAVCGGPALLRPALPADVDI